LIFGYGCPYPLDLNNVAEAAKTNCEADSGLLRAGLLESINPGDIVVLRVYFPKRQYIRLTRESLQSGATSAYDKEIESIYHAISSRGGSLLLIGSNPTVELNPVCLHQQWFNTLQTTDCNEIRLASSLLSDFALRHDLHLLNQFAGKYPDFEVISPTRFLCDANLGVCPVMLNGSDLYKDNEHISSTAIDLIYPEILSSLHRLARK